PRPRRPPVTSCSDPAPPLVLSAELVPFQSSPRMNPNAIWSAPVFRCAHLSVFYRGTPGFVKCPMSSAYSSPERVARLPSRRGLERTRVRRRGTERARGHRALRLQAQIRRIPGESGRTIESYRHLRAGLLALR